MTLTLTRSVLGQLMGVAWLAYFTSEMVQLVTNMNQRDELARSKISRVEVFAHHARLPSELNLRVKKHLEHVLLAKKIDLDTNELLAELSAPLRGEVGACTCTSATSVSTPCISWLLRLPLRHPQPLST